MSFSIRRLYRGDTSWDFLGVSKSSTGSCTFEFSIVEVHVTTCPAVSVKLLDFGGAHPLRTPVRAALQRQIVFRA